MAYIWRIRASTSRLDKSDPSNALGHARARPWIVTGHPSKNGFHISIPQVRNIKSILLHATQLSLTGASSGSAPAHPGHAGQLAAPHRVLVRLPAR